MSKDSEMNDVERAAEEYASKYRYRGEPSWDYQITRNAFETGASWAVQHDPRVKALVEALESRLSASEETVGRLREALAAIQNKTILWRSGECKRVAIACHEIARAALTPAEKGGEK